MAEDWDGRQNIGASVHNYEPSHSRIKAKRKHELSNKKLCSKMEAAAAIQFQQLASCSPCHHADTVVSVAMTSAGAVSSVSIKETQGSSCTAVHLSVPCPDGKGVKPVAWSNYFAIYSSI